MFLAPIVALAQMLSGAAPPAPEPVAEVAVSAASSLTDAMKQASAAFGKVGGPAIVFNFGASSLLARQIEEGAPADLFFSADEAKMDDLDRKGLVDKDSRRSLLSNTLVIVVTREGGPDVHGAADLMNPAIRSLALGETRSVPVGIYAREYLVRQKLWNGLKAKVVPTENVRAALAAVESGNADTAIVYKTDALISSRVRIAFEVAVDDGPKISYPVAVLRGAKNSTGARRFLAFLASPEGLAIFRKFGFRVS